MHFRIRDLAAERCVWSFPPIDTVPVKLRCRMLDVRAFDVHDDIVGQELSEGAKLAGVIAQLFADRRAAYIHVYFATDQTYAARRSLQVCRRHYVVPAIPGRFRAAPSVNRFLAPRPAHDRAGIVRRLINSATWIAHARHTGAALADVGALAASTVRGPVRMVLANPSGIITDRACHEPFAHRSGCAPV
jgi:hypothetical protein